mmetsp:Transcript_3911/g.11084  ORF Transcript_3911/g.11084 Transcript_3911/m.11084 type:complete len:588 (+) Transcript_3911:294-2057(+)
MGNPSTSGRRKCIASIDTLFRSIVAFVAFAFVMQVVMMRNHLEAAHSESAASKDRLWNPARESAVDEPGSNTKEREKEREKEKAMTRSSPPLPEHLVESIPILPLFDSVPNAQDRIHDVLEGKPSMVGVLAVLQKFLSTLHDRNTERIRAGHDGHRALKDFYETADKHLRPMEEAYRRKYVVPLRSDGSLFVSVAAFREHLLTETLVSAYKHAKHPERLFIGAVVQNCFGTVLANGTIDTSGTPCISGPVRVGPPPAPGKKPKTKKLPAPPDVNGVEIFCNLPDYKQYCDRGQVRVLYIHATDSLGPSMARYYASRLWGGENYYVQIDSHLRFAHHWDAKFVAELKATRSYPRSVLSTYPPGFEQVKFIPKHMNIDKSKVNNETVIESPGCRLCTCRTPLGEANPIIHINQGKSYIGNESLPTQTPYLGAGLIVAHADFLKEVPFDPFLPWTFMGEEILLSMRAWTHGWNIYAPRKNLIIHQYRTGILGIPKFVGAVNSQSKRGFHTGWLQRGPMRRIKHLCGYPNQSVEEIQANGQGFVLVDREHYGLGSERSWEDYLKFSELTVNHTSGLLDCHPVKWCNYGLKT